MAAKAEKLDRCESKSDQYKYTNLIIVYLICFCFKRLEEVANDYIIILTLLVHE